MVCSGTYTDTIIKFKQKLLKQKKLQRNPASKQVRRQELTPETLSSDPHMWIHTQAHKHVCTKIVLKNRGVEMAQEATLMA